MIRGRPLLLSLSCLVSVLALESLNYDVPQGIRIPLGMVMVFILPGFAFVCAALPARQLSQWECLLASVGISIAVTVVAAVALAAAPVGLSRLSLTIALVGWTVALCIYSLAWAAFSRSSA